MEVLQGTLEAPAIQLSSHKHEVLDPQEVTLLVEGVERDTEFSTCQLGAYGPPVKGFLFELVAVNGTGTFFRRRTKKKTFGLFWEVSITHVSCDGFVLCLCERSVSYPPSTCRVRGVHHKQQSIDASRCQVRRFFFLAKNDTTAVAASSSCNRGHFRLRFVHAQRSRRRQGTAVSASVETSCGRRREFSREQTLHL